MSAVVLRELVARLGLTVDEGAFTKADAGLAKVKKGLEDVDRRARDTSGRFVRGARQQADAAEAHASRQSASQRRRDREQPSASDTFQQYLGGAAVFAGLKYMTDLASQANETENVLKELFGQPGVEQIKNWSDSTSVALNRSKYELRESTSAFGALLTPVSKNTTEVRDMSEALSVLAIDLASFYYGTDEEAMLALRSGLIGQSEPLLKYAINVQDATLKEYARTQGIHKSIEKMTNAEKTLLRYKSILEQSKKAQGDATRTAHEYANALRGLDARVKELATDLGKKLLPPLKVFYEWATDALVQLGKLTDTSNIFQGALSALGLVILQTFGGKLWALTLFGLKLAIISHVIDDIITFAQGGDSAISRFLNAVGGKGFSTKTLEAISQALRDIKRDWNALIEALKDVKWVETWDSWANTVKNLDTALSEVSFKAKRFLTGATQNTPLPGEDTSKPTWRTYGDYDMDKAIQDAKDDYDYQAWRAHAGNAHASTLARTQADAAAALSSPAPSDPELGLNLSSERISADPRALPNMSVYQGDTTINMSLPAGANPDDYRRATERGLGIANRQALDAIRNAAGRQSR